MRLLLALLLCACAGSPPRDPLTAPPTWLARFGAAHAVTLTGALAHDGQGGLYLLLDTDAAMEGTLRGIRDLALVHLTLDGSIDWVRQIGADSMFTRAPALGVDSDGNVYAAGLVN